MNWRMCLMEYVELLMQEAMNKDGFVVYKSFYAPIKELSDESLGKLFRAIFEYQINGVIIELPMDLMMAFSFFRTRFELDNDKYKTIIERNKENGKKGGRPPKEENRKNPVGLEEPKKADKDRIGLDRIGLEDEIKEEKEDKSSEKKVLTWRNDFNVFLSEVNKAKNMLLADNEFKKKQEMYYPNLNYELTLQKMVEDYWGTEDAWNKRKKSKKSGEGINMLTTLKKAFSQSCNRVYKGKAYGQQQIFKSYTPYNTSESARNYLSTLKVDVVREVDGVKYLKDGTYIENNKRYYRTKFGSLKEVPIGLIGRPDEDWEYDNKTMVWVQDERKETIDDMLF